MRMPKRRRLESFCVKHRAYTNEHVCDELEDGQLQPETFETSKISNDEVTKKANVECSKDSSLELTDFDSPTVNEENNDSPKLSVLPATDIIGCIRRKSNRISSLKKLNNKDAQQQGFGETAQVIQNAAESNKIQQQTFIDSTSIAFSLSPQATNNPTNKAGVTQQIGVSQATSSSSGVGKSIRKNQVWTEDDIRWFFEALCEHGKDFPHIQTYIAARCEKKGLPQDSIKNYEQVRHFYYRMWHKISQILKISSDVDKGVQEIYGLINYGEIWKKLGTKLDSKLSLFLQQLVDCGYTVVKVKGKSIRFRTPVCNALKKIHNINNKISKPITQPIPKEVTVELIPATNADWIRVQSLAQNPRLRTKLTVQHRLSTLISYLEKRWNVDRLNQAISKSLLGVDLKQTIMSPSTSKDFSDSDSEKTSQENPTSFSILLRPLASEKLRDMVILKRTSNSISYHNYRSTTQGTSQIDLSLSAYMKNMFNDGSCSQKNKNKIRKASSKKLASHSIKNQSQLNDLKENVTKEKNQEEEVKDDNDEPQPIDLFRLLDSMNEELEVSKINDKTLKLNEQKSNNDTKDENLAEIVFSQAKNGFADVSNRQNSDELMKLPEPPEHKTLAQWLAGDSGDTKDGYENSVKDEENCQETTKISEDINDKISEDPSFFDAKITENSKKNSFEAATSSANDTINLLQADQARLGWTWEQGKSITIGELYLLFYQPSKIVLEYIWVSNEQNKQQSEPSLLNHSDVNIQAQQTPAKPMSVLQKLLIAANLALMNYKKQNNQHTNQHAQSNSSSVTNSSSVLLSPVKTSRKRATKQTVQNTNSQLLSNLIQETILNDSNQDKIIKNDYNELKQPSENRSMNLSIETAVNKEKFLASSIKSKCRTTAVLDDPAEVEEVLKELKNRARQRRPFNKFQQIYNQNKIFNSQLHSIHSGSAQQSAMFLIQASKLTTNEVSNNNVLNNAINSPHHPHQTLSSIEQLVPPDTSSDFFRKVNIQANNHQLQEKLSTNELKFTTRAMIHAEPTSLFNGEMMSGKSETTDSRFSEKNNITNYNDEAPLRPIIIEASDADIDQQKPFIPVTITTNTTTTIRDEISDSQLVKNRHQQPIIVNNESLMIISSSSSMAQKAAQTVDNKAASLPKSNHDDPYTLQVSSSWLNDVNNDISLSSLFCDNNGGGGGCSGGETNLMSNEDMTTISHKLMTTNEQNATEIESHTLSTFTNDNSVELMAKFADLAEKIECESKNI